MSPPHPSLPPEVQQRIAAAAAELTGAEQALRSTLEDLPAADRAYKRIVSAALQTALAKLAAAKKRLEEVLA